MPNPINAAPLEGDLSARTAGRTYLIGYDYWLLGSYLVLLLIGLFFSLDIQSIRPTMGVFYRHLAFTVFSLICMVVAFRLPNLSKLRWLNFPMLAVTIGLLVLVLLIGKGASDTKRFIDLGPINIQPSDIARVVLVFYVAHVLDKKRDLIPESTPKGMWLHFKPILIVPPAIYALILLERHFSTLVISGTTIMCMLWLAQIRKRTFLVVLAIVVLAGVVVLTKGEEYRQGRLNIFRHYSLYSKLMGEPKTELEEDAYQVKESLVALSSGRLLGTGTAGGRGKYRFLPEADTDYIFSIIGEETGFLGATIVILLYGVLFFRGFFGAWHSDDFYIRLLGAGLVLNIFLNAMVNIGVAMSALPSTGVTLPFISYGGTSLVVNSISLGLLLNISARRRQVW